MVKRIEFDDAVQADAVAPDEGVVQQEPVVITAEVGGGTVTWQPGDHMQMHLQQAAEAGELDEAIGALKEMLTDQIEEIQAEVCMMELLSNPEIMAELLSQVFVAGSDGIDAFPSFTMPGSAFAGEPMFADPFRF